LGGRKRFDKQLRYPIAEPIMVKAVLKDGQYINEVVEVLPPISPRDVPDFEEVKQYLK
jgi:hypothetical protein